MCSVQRKKPHKILRTAKELAEYNLIPKDLEKLTDEVSRSFSIAITPEMFQLIDNSNSHDPIAMQFVPKPAELDIDPTELNDPIGDDIHTKVKGIVHRYPDRCLLKLIDVCAVYCRFCFRREKLQDGKSSLSKEEFDVAINYIETHPEIWEVILTGGDPLMFKPKQLSNILIRLRNIPHVEVIRIHTRIPIVDPKKINDEMIKALKSSKVTFVVVHANHSKEFSDNSKKACAVLVDAGIPLLSQTVLLKGINDDVASLTDLMKTLIRNRIKPYYLHHGDLARGTKHFRTTIEEGVEILRKMRGSVSGICLPTYILDIPGGHGKVPIQHNYIKKQPSSTKIQYVIEDPTGEFHNYE